MPGPQPDLAVRTKSQGQIATPAPPQFDDIIIFPKLYEDAWGSADGGTAYRTDLDRTRIFLLRVAKMSPEALAFKQIRTIVSDKTISSVPAIAAAIKTRIFGDRHASFAANELLQVVRFVLVKSQMAVSNLARDVADFFFDPTMERSMRPPPSGAIVTYKYPAARLKVLICGGGPTALASAISLAEKGQGRVEIHMYEGRWTSNKGRGGVEVVDYPATARRRDQVVTLQDSVTTLLSKESYQALFAGRPERVWPASANIQIRKVEDRFLKRIQDPEFRGIIHLHCENLSREKLATVGDFHVLLGADGAASWVRKSYFQGYETERGRSYALGLAFDRPAGLPWSQPLNMFLTLGQTRYLLNASDHDGRGYLNMQLTEEEWHKMVAVDGQVVQFGRPGCLRKPDGSIPAGFEEGQVFAPSEDRASPLWISIADGLKLFGFKESEVINVVRIPIVVQAVKEGVQKLPPADSPSIRRPHALVAVAGDAAMTVHFWPGRGLNSGIKTGLALGDEIVYALDRGMFIGMPLGAMKEFNDFIIKLQGREHDKRSIPILNQSGTPDTLGWLLEKANTVPDNVAVEWLVGAMTQIASRLQGRDDWSFDTITNLDPQIRIVLRQLNSVTLREMAVSFPWPTREMAGAEVLPIRSMKPEEKQKWLQGLWNMLREERKSKDKSSTVTPDAPSSSGRFEAPRIKSLPPPSGLQRSNATETRRESKDLSLPNNDGSAGSPSPSASRRGSRNLPVPSTNGLSRSRSPSPSPFDKDGNVSLGRMLTVHKKPANSMLSDAMSFALVCVDQPNVA